MIIIQTLNLSGGVKKDLLLQERTPFSRQPEGSH